MKKVQSIFLLLIVLSAQSFSQSEEDQIQNITSQIGLISVTIGGDFIVTGTFTAYPTERVDQFVTRMYNESRAEMLAATKDDITFKSLMGKFEKVPQRDIALIKPNGDKKKIDLLRFRLSGDFNLNPYLENDDVLIFPAVNLESSYFEVSGAVNHPGKIQYVDGDKLSDAIFFARGIDKSYDNVSSAKIYRLSQSGNVENIIEVNLDNDIELERGDRIEILGEASFKKDYSVLVLGEVNKPGEIFIKQDGNELWEVINRAGGFKETASLAHSELLRNSSVSDILKKEYIRNQYENGEDITFTKIEDLNQYFTNVEKLAMLRMSNFTEDDSLIFSIDNELRMMNSIGNIDFNNLSDPNSPDSKFTVLDKDVIIVPKKVEQIYLFGQIPQRGYHKYVEGESYHYYIQAAGGMGNFASGDVYIIDGKTREWIDVEENENYVLQPGDFIYVPKSPARSFSFYLENIARVAGILGSVATIALLIDQLSK